MQMLGTRLHHTTAYHPQANGLVERSNAVLKDRLRTYVEEVGREWPSAMVDFQAAWNTSVNSVTGFTPFLVMHGWEARMAYDILVERRSEPASLSVQKYRERVIKVMEDTWEEARLNMGENDAKRRWKELTLAKSRNPPPVFVIGSQVLLRKLHWNKGEHKASTYLWLGPYEVVRKVSDVVYVIDKEGEESCVHVDRMRKYVAERKRTLWGKVKKLDGEASAEGDAESESDSESEEKERELVLEDHWCAISFITDTPRVTC